MNLNSFDNFLNNVWDEVYIWKYEITDHTGRIIGGWNPLIWDNLIFEHYTEYGGYWEGFCPSSMDFAYGSSDPSNQFTATTLGGVDGKGTPYMIGYYGYDTGHENACKITLEDGISCEVQGMYITNLHYTYLSILTGDGFSRPFKQGDWFLLSAHGYDENCEYTGSVDFYLADFRSENPEEHILIDDWIWMDLSSLGKVMYLEFEMMSSDYSIYGINTPTYFCMDKLTFSLLSIKKQPENIEICEGEDAQFSIRISGNDYFNEKINDFFPHIQWRKDGVDIPGENDTILIIQNVRPEDAGEYTCHIVSNYYSEYYRSVLNDKKVELVSETAILQISKKLESLSQSESQELWSGNSTELSLSLTGTSPSFQWYKDGNKLTGETSGTLRLTNLKPSDSGGYYCIAANLCNTVESEKIELNIRDIVLEIVRSPEDRVICRNEDLQLEVEAIGTGLHYQWFRNNYLVSGATSAVLMIHNVTETHTGEYYCSVSNSTGTKDSEKAIVTVLERPSVKEKSGIQRIHEKENIHLSIKATGPALKYQWYKDGQEITGATSDNLFIENAAYEDSGTYYCTVINTCESIQTENIPVFVLVPKIIYPNPCPRGEPIRLYGYKGYIITYYTEDGKTISQYRINSQTWELPELYPEGIYIINAEKEEKNLLEPAQKSTKVIIK
jgi:hypothetical protein